MGSFQSRTVTDRDSDYTTLNDDDVERKTTQGLKEAQKKKIDEFKVPDSSGFCARSAKSCKDCARRALVVVQDNALYRCCMSLAKIGSIFAGVFSDIAVTALLFNLGHFIWGIQSVVYTLSPYIIFAVFFRNTGVAFVNNIAQSAFASCQSGFNKEADPIPLPMFVSQFIYVLGCIPSFICADYGLHVYYVGREPSNLQLYNLMQLRQVLDVVESALNTTFQGYIFLRRHFGLHPTPKIDMKLLCVSLGSSALSLTRAYLWLRKYSVLQTDGSKVRLIARMANLGEGIAPSVLLSKLLNSRRVVCEYDLSSCTRPALLSIGTTVGTSSVLECLVFKNCDWIDTWCSQNSSSDFNSSLLTNCLKNKTTLRELEFDGRLPLDVLSFIQTSIARHPTVQRVKVLGKDVAQNQFLENFDQLEPILRSTWNGEFEEVVKVIESSPADLDVTDRQGNSACLLAAIRGHTAILKAILAANYEVEIHRRNANGDSALMLAASEGNGQCVDLLLAAGADVDDTNFSSETALMTACSNAHKDCIKKLLNANSDVWKVDSNQDNALRKLLLNSGDYPSVQLILAQVEAGDRRRDYVNMKNYDVRTAFMAASAEGFHQALKILIKEHADITTVDRWRQTCLHKAASNGRTDALELLLQSRAAVAKQDKDGNTALALAAKSGFPDVVNILLNDPKGRKSAMTPNINGITPLHHACSCTSGDTIATRIVTELIRCQAIVQTVDITSGDTPLLSALLRGNMSVARELLSSKAHASDTNFQREDALQCLAIGGKIEMLETFVSKCDINGCSMKGYTALHAAIFYNRLEMVKSLLKFRANPRPPLMNQTLSSPVSTAAKYGTVEMLQVLENAKCDLTLQDADGYSPMMTAFDQEKTQNAKWLLERKADVNVVDIRGNSALRCVFNRGDLEGVRLLLEAKANPNQVTVEGESLLNNYLANGKSGEDVALELIEQKADPCFSGPHMQPIHYAAYEGSIRVVEKLIEQRSSVNVRTDGGNTPLMMAVFAKNDSTKVIRKLIESAADVNICHVGGSGPLWYAVQNDDATLVEELLTKKADPLAVNRDLWDQTPVHQAFKKGSKKICELILQIVQKTMSNAELVKRTKTHEWKTLMHFAASSNSEAALKFALDLGLSVNDKTTSGDGPLSLALSASKVKSVRWLLQQKAQADQRTNTCASALDIAIPLPQIPIELCQQLYDKGSRIGRTCDGFTPLHSCTEHGLEERLEYALEKGGKSMIEAGQMQNSTALMFSVINLNMQALQLLLAVKANVNHRSLYNATAVYEAINPQFSGESQEHGGGVALDVGRLLLESRASPNSNVENIQCAMCKAMENNKLDYAQLMYEYKADIEFERKDLVSPIHKAANTGKEATEWLLEKGVMANVATSSGFTPVHYAAAAGHVEVVRSLLDHHGNVLGEGFTGQTPLRFAASNSTDGALATIRLLLVQNADPFHTDLYGQSALSSSVTNLPKLQALLRETSIQRFLRHSCNGFPLGYMVFFHGDIDVCQWLLSVVQEAGESIDINYQCEGSSTPTYTALMYAAAFSSAEKVCFLLSLKADVNMTTSDGNTALTVTKDTTIVAKLLAARANVNATTIYGDTAFLYAASNKSLALCKMLVAKKADVGARRKDGTGALHLAAAAGSVELVSWLIDACGADINMKNLEGTTPLLAAAFEGADEVRLLWHRKADIGCKDVGGRNAVWYASANNIGTVSKLVDEGVPLDVDERGISPWHRFAERGHTTIWTFLSKFGTESINVKWNAGFTPLMYIARLGLPVPVQMLLQTRADPTIRNWRGRDALHETAEAGSSVCHAETFRTLIAARCPVDSRDHQGVTPLMRVAASGQIEALRFLISAKADVNAADNDGSRVVHHSAHDTIGALKIVLDARADINAVDHKGMTTLHHAATTSNAALVQFLLRKGQDPLQQTTFDGSLPAHVVAPLGNFVGDGLFPRFCGPDFDGWTPIYLAAVAGHLQMVRCFLNGRLGDGGFAALQANSTFFEEVSISQLARVQHAFNDENYELARFNTTRMAGWDVTKKVPLEVLDTWPGSMRSALVEDNRVFIWSNKRVGCPTLGRSSGKWHFEITVFGSYGLDVGWIDSRYRKFIYDICDHPGGWCVEVAQKKRGHNGLRERWRCPPWIKKCPQRLGLAIDFESRRLLMTNDGTWHTAFEGFEGFEKEVFPCAKAVRAALKFHVSDLEFAPPDSTFLRYDQSVSTAPRQAAATPDSRPVQQGDVQQPQPQAKDGKAKMGIFRR